VFKFMFVFS